MALAGARFTFGSAGSTSGRLMPEFFIRKFTGKSPEEFFGMPNQYSTGHDDTAKRVESGAFDAGAINYTTYDKMVASGELDPNLCRIVWKTPTYADYNFTAHPALDESYGAGFIDKLQQVLTSMDSTKTAAFDRKRFIAASNEDFAAIAEVAAKLGFIRP